MFSNSTLREVVRYLCHGQAKRTQIHHLLVLLHRHATAYLGYKASHFGPVPDEPVPELAFRCVEPLFRTSGPGRFPILASYYTRLRWHSLSEEKLFAATRRLAASAVNAYLYRGYRQPLYASDKLLNVLSDATHEHPDFSLRQLQGTPWICLDIERMQPHALHPVLPPELIVPHLPSDCRGIPFFAALYDRLKRLLTIHAGYLNRYPLVLWSDLVHGRLQRIAHEHGASYDDVLMCILNPKLR